MKFLIIGASGFIGGHLYKYLKEKGYDVIGTQTKPRQNGLVVYNMLSSMGVKTISRDFFEGKEEKVCIIMAAVRQIDRCAEDPKFSYMVNVNQVFKVARELHSLGVKVVFISTSFVFDGVKGFYSETDKKSPACEYGRQKSFAEELVLKHAPGSLILRFDKILGTNPEQEHLFSEWLNLCKEGKPIFCIKDNFFPGTLVDDIAKSILLVCVKKLTGVYHVANTQSIMRSDLAKLFVKKMGFDVPVLERPLPYFRFKDSRSLNSSLDVRKFVSATGMEFTGFDEMIGVFRKRCKEKENWRR